MIIHHNTPIEKYEVDGYVINVKREDLSCADPAPRLAKLRGIYLRLQKLKAQGAVKIGVLDTRISKSGWGVTALANEIGGFIVFNFYPKRKDDKIDPEQVSKAKQLGAHIEPLKAGRLAIVYSRAKKFMEAQGGYMIPMGLVVEESVLAVKLEADRIPEEDLYGGTVVMAVGSGMSISGVSLSLSQKVHKIYGVSAGMSNSRQLARIKKVIGHLPLNVELVPPTDGYYDSAADVQVPFPCNEWYDKKAWRWMMLNLHHLRQPILFWNIGV